MALDGGVILEVWLSKKIWGKRCLGKKQALRYSFKQLSRILFLGEERSCMGEALPMAAQERSVAIRCILGGGRGGKGGKV